MPASRREVVWPIYFLFLVQFSDHLHHCLMVMFQLPISLGMVWYHLQLFAGSLESANSSKMIIRGCETHEVTLPSLNKSI